MELFRLMKDIYERRNTPLTYPLTLLGETFKEEEKLTTRLASLQLFTYRMGFSSLLRSSLHSDKGWGCLMRSMQMMLAESLLRLNCRSVEQFRDIDSDEAPFGVHQFVRHAAREGQAFSNDYWSPTQGCEACRGVVGDAVKKSKLRVPMGVYVAVNRKVVCEQVDFMLREIGAVLLLIPARVGCGRNIGQTTFIALERLLQARQSVGIVGGVPNRSYFIVGTSGQRILFLDPHMTVQPAYVNETTLGVHGETASTLPSVAWNRIDSSLVIGFFVTSGSEWADLCVYLQRQHAQGVEELFSVSTREQEAREEAAIAKALLTCPINVDG